MASDTPLTDDFLADLLSRDAKAVSSRTVATFGGAVSKRPASIAKPNTRFLKNILRNTDAHNAALLAKEEQEARARLAALQPGRRVPKRGDREVYSVRARREDVEHSVKRRRVDDHEESADRADDDVREGSSRKGFSRHHGRDEGGRKRHRSRDREDRSRSPDRKAIEGQRKRYSEKDSRTAVREDAGHIRDHRQDKHGDGARGEVIASHNHGQKHKRRSRSISTPTARTKPQTHHDNHDDESDSSLGPRPASKSPPRRFRGRGAGLPSTAIDQHFQSSYDPTSDMQPAVESDNWDQALEALRDRQKWKQSGAERLKAAGFTDREIKKWEGGAEVEGFRWAKQGESREWDRDKDLEDQ